MPPTIANKSKDEVTVVEGNVLFLLCKADGNPTPLVAWRKRGKLLQSSFNETNFIIHDAQNTDAGIYECTASNSAGTVSYKVEVTIIDKPRGEVILFNLSTIPTFNQFSQYSILMQNFCCLC